jgi:hypothetical protein
MKNPIHRILHKNGFAVNPLTPILKGHDDNDCQQHAVDSASREDDATKSIVVAPEESNQ